MVVLVKVIISLNICRGIIKGKSITYDRRWRNLIRDASQCAKEIIMGHWHFLGLVLGSNYFITIGFPCHEFISWSKVGRVISKKASGALRRLSFKNGKYEMRTHSFKRMIIAVYQKCGDKPALNSICVG